MAERSWAGFPDPNEAGRGSPCLDCAGEWFICVRIDRPKKVRLMDGGSDRLPGRGVAGWQVLLRGWGGAALAGEVCCHWSLGSGRLLPLGTSPAGRRERRGSPSWCPGSGLTLWRKHKVMEAAFTKVQIITSTLFFLELEKMT